MALDYDRPTSDYYPTPQKAINSLFSVIDFKNLKEEGWVLQNLAEVKLKRFIAIFLKVQSIVNLKKVKIILVINGKIVPTL